ncbi:MAG TPA: hypothetical protein VGN16_22805 [Acidobacteriaceae bacterium]
MIARTVVRKRYWDQYAGITLQDGVPFPENLSPPSLKQIAEATFPTRWGSALLRGFVMPSGEVEVMGVLFGDWQRENVLLHLHACCLYGDVFGSCLCACHETLHRTMQTMQQEGAGIVLYLNARENGLGSALKRHVHRLDGNEDSANNCGTFTPLEFEACLVVLKQLQVSSIRFNESC